MSKKVVGITRMETREEQLRTVLYDLVVQLHKGGFSYGEISTILNIDKAGANRVVRFGSRVSKRASVS